LRASRSALEICFGGSYSPGVFVIGSPIFISRSCLSVWPIYSDIPEFLRTFKEATLTAGLIVRLAAVSVMSSIALQAISRARFFWPSLDW
jgi:hypothetical protein